MKEATELICNIGRVFRELFLLIVLLVLMFVKLVEDIVMSAVRTNRRH